MKKRYQRWLRIGLYVVLVLVGQSSAILLGRLYYQEGGNSIWIATLVQLVGFPILLPFYTIPASKHSIHHNDKQPSASMLASVYVSLGLLLSLDCFLYAVGLSNLPVSTYSLICSSKLAFNAFFSFFLNSQKFTPYIINSVFLLTISSILLVLQTGSSAESNSEVSDKKKYAIGFISTLAAAAVYGLMLSLTQLAFSKVVGGKSFKATLDMIVYPSLVACLVTVIGLFGSGEYSVLNAEMEEYEMGKTSYVLTLSFTAITWQVYAVGCLSLIVEVSSLFSNALSIVGLPIVPILGVLLFHDTMNGLKVISLVLAFWGFLSYVYQQYLDETDSKDSSTTHKP
ncbi:purine permease 21-like [Neltuma alba]|uniref:purine permease 21-like n=1 Tax=Neltuma alba TaxID=207710 RepID=UPI0010A5639C|nr:purine permease 21-like [Prosopis alba]